MKLQGLCHKMSQINQNWMQKFQKIELDDPSIELTKERYIIWEKKQALMDAVR